MRAGVWTGTFVSAVCAVYVGGASARILDKRNGQSSAICLDEFSWMDNSIGQQPCLVAAWLLSQCAGGNWLLRPLPNATFHYETPGFNDTTASLCSCSWATYNTLQACAFCQGELFESAIITWDAYNPNCTNFSSGNAPWSSSVVIPDETAIPFWAEHNPTQWANSKFDPTVAQQLASENKPDLSEADRTKKSTPTGAIVGGVVGGVVAIAVMGLVMFKFFWRGKGTKHFSLGTSYRPMRHARSISDNSKYTEFTGSPSPGLPMSVASSIPHRPPFHQHNTSTHSLPGQHSIMSVSFTPHPPDYGVLPAGAAMPAVGAAMGSVPLNSPPTSYPGRPAGVAPSGYGHAHTLSEQSNISSIPSTHGRSISHSSDTPEGAISPFFLSPTEQQAPVNTNRAKTAQDVSPTQTTVAANAVTGSPTRKAERMNPPAYSPVSSPEERMFNSSIGHMSFSNASVDAHAAESQGLSGTTLQESREPTVVSVSEAHEEEERHTFPPDRKP